MNIRFLIAALILVFTTHSSRSVGSVVIQQDEISTDEYSVYKAVIGTMFAGNKVTFDFGGNLAVKRLLIEDHTVAYPFYQGRSIFPSLEAETVDDYSANNKQPARLKPSLNLTMKYVLIKVGEFKKSDTVEANDQIAEPDGRIGLSRVGFNRDRSQALVYMTYVCGALCGHGFFLFLRKVEGEWKVEKRFHAWIS